MKSNLWNLTGQRVLITGATHGIGKSIAEEFLKLDAEVIIIARDQSNLSSLLEEWTKESYKVSGLICDVTDITQRQQLVEKIKIQYGELNVLINNVGPNFKKPIMEYTFDEYQSLINNNMTTTFHLTQLCYPLLTAAKSACIINISGISSQKAFVGSGPYGMAKSAVESFTRSLAIELGEKGIRANSIVPGFISTPTFSKKYDELYLQRAVEKVPLKRLGIADDVAGLACFLAMPASSYITGQCIIVDGGFSIYGFQHIK
jgi:tropinone reductase I